MTQNEEKILVVDQLKQYFNPNTAKELKAVDGISFHINRGETFGLVGESGSGKTTAGRSIMHLYNPTGGRIIFEGKDISQLKTKEEILSFRNDVQMIFQDPYASLNPRMKVLDIISEGISIHQPDQDSQKTEERVYELLDQVGLNKDHASRYPHEFSGGQRQRIGIARALAVNPKLIIADEPISALDVSVQAQIVNLLMELQEEYGLSYLFIAHDLSMVKHISDQIGVMYHGKLLEIASSDELYANPLHPYTKSLLSAIPLPDPIAERKRQRILYEPELMDGTEQMHEIVPGHFVYCTLEEVEGYVSKSQSI